MGHLLILSRQRLIFLTTHNGVHEETARIAHHLRIRQFGIADIDNNVSHLLGSRIPDASPFEFRTDISIMKTGCKLLLKGIFY